MTSCSEKQQAVVNGVSFEIQSFDDFLWEKDPVDTISIVLNAEFKECEDACGSLAFIICDSEQNEVSADVVTVYVDGQKTENNRIDVPVDCGVVDTKIGLVVNESQLLEDVTFDWHLKLVNDAGLKKVLFKDENNTVEIIGKDDPWIFGTDICIKNTHVANTLKVWTNTIVLVVLSVIVAWILLLQINVPRFNQKHIRSIFIITNGARRCITNCTSDAERSVEIVMSSQELKQSFISKLFMGRKCFVKLENFPAELHMTPKKGGKVNYKSEPRTAFKMTRNGQVHLLTSTTESKTTYQVEFK